MTVERYAKDVLVSTEWVEEHLGDDSIRIVEVDENPALYVDAHIPGALSLDWRDDLQDPLVRDLLGAGPLGELLGSLGIANEHVIVLYGDRRNLFAAYAYWYLRYHGHERLALMDGGRTKWIAENRPVTSDATHHQPAIYTAQPGDESIRARRDDVLAAISSPTRLLDVRSRAEFSGELISPPGYDQEGALRSGHVPTAISMPWSHALREDGTFRPRWELEELYPAGGDDGVIAYCRIGERSAHTWFVLHELLGREQVRNYDGSWTEWGNLVGVPIERDV